MNMYMYASALIYSIFMCTVWKTLLSVCMLHPELEFGVIVRRLSYIPLYATYIDRK